MPFFLALPHRLRFEQRIQMQTVQFASWKWMRHQCEWGAKEKQRQWFLVFGGHFFGWIENHNCAHTIAVAWTRTHCAYFAYSLLATALQNANQLLAHKTLRMSQCEYKSVWRRWQSWSLQKKNEINKFYQHIEWPNGAYLNVGTHNAFKAMQHATVQLFFLLFCCKRRNPHSYPNLLYSNINRLSAANWNQHVEWHQISFLKWKQKHSHQKKKTNKTRKSIWCASIYIICKRAFIESVPICSSRKHGPRKAEAMAACCININKIDLKLSTHTHTHSHACTHTHLLMRPKNMFIFFGVEVEPKSTSKYMDWAHSAHACLPSRLSNALLCFALLNARL